MDLINNKVYLKGQIINSVRLKFDKQFGCDIVYFILGVERELNNTAYNNDKMAYFYCYMSEKDTDRVSIQEIKKALKMYSKIEINGILENRYNMDKNIIAKEVNYRALNSYVSTICICDYKVFPDSNEYEKSKEIVYINSIRKTFGKNAEISFSEGAFDKNIFGLENDDISDY